MSTLLLDGGQLKNALRARTADFFKMNVVCASTNSPPNDPNPLRRPLNRLQASVCETNENMCFALWQLTARG